ncbi:RRXRR domain-containing protein [Mastigocoleus testarum]|uniref:RRXRR domain-containing protein n=1 Tax=Mastigocoleus testarum BC008 TaxID=371196 RepID=A0A0V7ZEW9_9CYAN|nr:RRXRR domain-containing protein [Mastigocoleus testarum]KST62991.1 hypothetical protein BC008_11805 [Mastigocoleus testarum BC008]
MLRVPVIDKNGRALMPTKPSRARRWLKEGRAKVYKNDLQVFAIQLTFEPSDRKEQRIAVGIDPGKHFTGIAVQSAKFTLWLGHLYLPFQKVKVLMEQRGMMRRTRRSRRINRNLPVRQRAHRQKRFDNRRQNKIPPSIRANRDLEKRVLDELERLFPLLFNVVIERVKAYGNKGFSPVMVAQEWQLDRLSFDYGIETIEGWQTAQIRRELGLIKQKDSKSDAVVATHAVDGIALAASQFMSYQVTSVNSRGWVGSVDVTACPLTVIRRPPVSRRQLHLLQFSKGGSRRKYGGTVTRHGFRKGDYVEANQGKKIVRGWVSGDTKTQISVSNADWKRLGQFSRNKIQLLKRSNGLIVQCG